MIKTIFTFFDFAGEQKKYLIKGTVLAVINSMFKAMQLLAVSVVLQAIVEDTVSMSTVYTSLGIMVISIIGNIIFGHTSRMSSVDGTFNMCTDKRIAIGERMKYMPMGYFNSNSLGDITAVVTNTLEDLQNIGPRIMEATTHGFIYAGIITLMLMFFDWRIGCIMVGGIIVFGFITSIMQRQSRKASPLRVASQTKLVGAILEYVQGMSIVKSFNLIGDAHKTMDQAIIEAEKQNVNLEFTFNPYMFFQTVALKLASLLIVFSSIAFYFDGTMTLSNCLLMLLASFLIYSQLETAGSLSALLRTIDIGMENISAIYESPVMDIDGKDIKTKTYDIIGKNVSFAYGNKSIINNVDFKIPEKTTTAIVGPSGSGKTTLCNLIARFWDLDSGEITIGNTDVKAYTLDSLLTNISMVFQNVYLFNDTIINNIRFGKPNATKAEVIEAARKACCHDFITALPEGYNTMIGEGGATISGGEKQRISIARAILKDAPIIILDEATANVDPENESRLQLAIEELTKDKTIIMIAHRLKTVQNADQILVLDEGKIVQKGTHEILIKENGIYADFINIREQAVGWKL
ncbi:MAG: ABC transporter ATP-binding protein [Coprobacillaceae bacterium]